MAKTLDQELTEAKVAETPNQFRQIIKKAHQKMFPELNDEQLLQEPSKAVQFVGAVRAQVGAKVPEGLICRTLTNMRKHKEKT